MFSKLTVSFLTSLALLIPLALPATLQAQPQVVVIAPPSYHRHYFVEFRPSPFMPWQAYGPYRSRGYAHDVARGLRAQGLQVRIVHR